MRRLWASKVLNPSMAPLGGGGAFDPGLGRAVLARWRRQMAGLRLVEVTAGVGKAGGLVDLPAEVEDRQARDRAQPSRTRQMSPSGHMRVQQ